MFLKKKNLVILGIIIVVVILKNFWIAIFWRTYFLRDFHKNKDNYYMMIDFLNQNKNVSAISPKQIIFKITGIYCYKQDLQTWPIKLMDLGKDLKTDDIICDSQYQDIFNKIQVLNTTFSRDNNKIIFDSINSKLKSHGEYMYCSNWCDGNFDNKKLMRKLENGKIAILQ